jgi:hypothetical protein
MKTEKRYLPAQFDFLSDCSHAISEERYREALEIFLDGVVGAIEAGKAVNSQHLMMQLLLIAEELESTLKTAFGADWQDRIAIPEVPAEQKKIRCSFCGKAHEEVLKIIAGPTVFICNECIALSNEILSEQNQN